MQDVYIGRQPIFDRNLGLNAYELLYRTNRLENTANVLDHDLATTQVMINTFLEFGLEQLAGAKTVFINLPRSFILGKNPIPFPKGQIVLEILEGIKIDEAFLNAVRKLRAAGYEFALDDFIYHSELQPLIRLSKIVKIDFRVLSRDQIREHVKSLQEFNVELLAEKIETHEEFEFAKEQGFGLFQGYFLCKPNIVIGRSLPPSRLAILRLLSELMDPQKKIAELAELVSQDVALSFKLLRSLNSPFYSLPKRVESIHHAIVYLGLQQIKQWVSLLVLAQIPDKPSQLVTMSLLRGKFCELIGEASGDEHKESLFTVGMFSLLDALMDSNLENILVELPLSPEIKAAILNHEGTMGHILHVVIAYEQGRWDEIEIPSLKPEKITEAYKQSLAWTEQAQQTL